MKRIRRPRSLSVRTVVTGWLLCLPVLLCLQGCRSPGVDLEDRKGRQWVWPYFSYRQPTVLAFWNCANIESIEAIPALTTLSKRDSDIQLVTVCTESNRARMDSWLSKQQGEFVILLDPQARLARQLDVRTYPTYIYFDIKGREVERYLDIRSVWKFFDIERFQELGRPQPASASGE